MAKAAELVQGEERVRVHSAGIPALRHTTPHCTTVRDSRERPCMSLRSRCCRRRGSR